MILIESVACQLCCVDSDNFDAKRNLPTSKNVRDYVVLGVSRVWHRENLFGNVAEKPHDVAEKPHDVAEKAMLLSWIPKETNFTTQV